MSVELVPHTKYIEFNLILNLRTLCLLVGYTNGFQVWDLTHTQEDPNKKNISDGKITELMNFSQAGCHTLQIYHLPRLPKQEGFTAGAVGIIRASEKNPSVPSNELRLFGLSTKVTKTISVDEQPIMNVLSNASAVILVWSISFF